MHRAIAVCLVACVAPPAWAADVKVCVNVEIKEHMTEEEALPPPEVRPEAPRPTGQMPFPPEPYLQRLLAHYVTHEHGFAAVDAGCDEVLRVELYPLLIGWTAFARYSRFQQEEKVDQVTYKELPRYAERVVLALLYNRRVEQTIDRTNVLEADSEGELESIRGKNHFATTVGTTLRVPVFGIDTAPDDPNAPARQQVRPLATVDLTLGYRGSFRSWALDAYVKLGVGANQKKAVRNNVLGGHIDHVIDAGGGLTFMWYSDPDAVNAFYGGLGGVLDVSVFTATEPQDLTSIRDRGALVGAGLSAMGVVGYEMLRTSSIRPYLQLSLNVPLYSFDLENDMGRLTGWIPSTTLLVGALF